MHSGQASHNHHVNMKKLVEFFTHYFKSNNPPPKLEENLVLKLKFILGLMVEDKAICVNLGTMSEEKRCILIY